jgi:ferrous iron transport protein A
MTRQYSTFHHVSEKIGIHTVNETHMSDSSKPKQTDSPEPIVQPIRPHATLLSRTSESQSAIPLSHAPVGERLRITAVRAGKTLEKRMISMGMPLGMEVEIMHRRGGSVVLVVGTSRVALGAGMVGKIMVEIV